MAAPAVPAPAEPEQDRWHSRVDDLGPFASVDAAATASTDRRRLSRDDRQPGHGRASPLRRCVFVTRRSMVRRDQGADRRSGGDRSASTGLSAVPSGGRHRTGQGRPDDIGPPAFFFHSCRGANGDGADEPRQASSQQNRLSRKGVHTTACGTTALCRRQRNATSWRHVPRARNEQGLSRRKYFSNTSYEDRSYLDGL